MVDFAIFNELSLPLESDLNAEDAFLKFLFLLKETKHKGIREIKSIYELKTLEIKPGFYFQQFMGSIVNRELKTKLRNLLANSPLPFRSPLNISQTNTDNELGIEYYYNGLIAHGLGCADMVDTLAISMPNSTSWNQDFIEIKKNELVECPCEIITNNVCVKHISDCSHLNSHSNYFFELQEYQIKNITQYNFWEKRDSLFTRVIFCNEVEEQLPKLHKNTFDSMIKKLLSVENGIKNITDFHWSPEGDNISNNPRLRSQREFTLPDGTVKYFTNHIKSFINGNRMHFLEIGENIYIGYIGVHLDL